MAAAIHILVADATGATSIEASARDLVMRDTDLDGSQPAHSNHFLHSHDERVSLMVIPDESVQRVKRATALMEAEVARVDGPPELAIFERILEDEDNGPFGINKAGTDAEPLRTLFSIVMDLDKRVATARFGRPTTQSER